MKSIKRSLFIREVEGTQEEMDFYDMLESDSSACDNDIQPLSEKELEEICNDPKVIDKTAEKLTDLFTDDGLFRGAVE